ncbi:MAG: hypothetical protein AAGG38_07830 [Planctomycetota bacterium]
MALVLGVCGGCHDHKLLQAQQSLRAGDVNSAQRDIREYARHHRDSGNALIAELERGSIALAAGDHETSGEAFARADELLREIDRQPDVSLSREMLAALTNLSTLPYRGTHYDRVMLSTYRALGALRQGDTDAARPYLITAYERQREAVAANAKRLEAAQSAAAPGTPDRGYDAARAQRDPRLQAALDRQYRPLAGLRAYADYVNPFAEWLQGVYFTAEAADGNDLERARVSFARTVSLVPGSGYVAQDAAAAERLAAGGAAEPVTYVVLATGVAPSRGEVRIDIPVFVFGGAVDYVGANFPRLIYHSNFLRDLTVRVPGEDGGERYTTELLSDMDSVVSQEFENELPIIVTKTLVAAGTKAALAYAIREAVDDQNNDLATLVRIFSLLYQYAANQADLRTWATLPKQFRIARLPTPPGGTILLTAPGQPTATVTLDPVQTNMVFVRSINTYAPWQAWQFSLGKDIR